jgi:2'-5' RNA ligase
MGEDYDKEKIAALKGLCEVVFGQRAENRPYVPHLTIARFKEEDFAGLPAALEKEVSWKMKIDSVALYESKLYHSGAEYEILRKIELRG